MQAQERLGTMLEELERVNHPDEVQSAFRQLGELYGIKNVAYLGVALQRLTREEPYIVVTYDQDWIARWCLHCVQSKLR